MCTSSMTISLFCSRNCLRRAMALVAGGRARDLKEGVGLAARSIDDGGARGKLEALVALSQRLAQEK